MKSSSKFQIHTVIDYTSQNQGMLLVNIIRVRESIQQLMQVVKRQFIFHLPTSTEANINSYTLMNV